MVLVLVVFLQWQLSCSLTSMAAPFCPSSAPITLVGIHSGQGLDPGMVQGGGQYMVIALVVTLQLAQAGHRNTIQQTPFQYQKDDLKV